MMLIIIALPHSAKRSLPKHPPSRVKGDFYCTIRFRFPHSFIN